MSATGCKDKETRDDDVDIESQKLQQWINENNLINLHEKQSREKLISDLNKLLIEWVNKENKVKHLIYFNRIFIFIRLIYM